MNTAETADCPQTQQSMAFTEPTMGFNPHRRAYGAPISFMGTNKPTDKQSGLLGDVIISVPPSLDASYTTTAPGRNASISAPGLTTLQLPAFASILPPSLVNEGGAPGLVFDPTNSTLTTNALRTIGPDPNPANAGIDVATVGQVITIGNTMSGENLGIGENVFLAKTATGVLQFAKLRAGSNLTITPEVDGDLIISAAGAPPAIDIWQYVVDTNALGSSVTLNPAFPGAVIPSDLVFPGTSTEDTPPPFGGVTLIFDASNGAFRAGQVNGAQWTQLQRGAQSVAFGLNTTASGAQSFAAGQGNLAAGVASFVGGGGSTGGNQALQDESFIGAGEFNVTSGTLTFIGAGSSNAAAGTCSFIGAGVLNAANGVNSFIGAGREGLTSGLDCFVGAGLGNQATGDYSFVGAGASGPVNNIASGNSSFIGAGATNLASGTNSFVGAGTNNQATIDNAGIVVGISNTVSAPGSVIGTGFGNSCTQQFSGILAGAFNSNTGAVCAIGAGTINTIGSIGSAFIGGGDQNSVLASSAIIGAGGQNTVMATGDRSFIGAGVGNTTSAAGGGVVCGGTSSGGNTASGIDSFVGAGSLNTASALNSAVVAGVSCFATGAQSAVVAGTSNSTSTANTFIGGGNGNTVSAANSLIVGGQLNSVTAAVASIVGGTGNTASATGAFVGGGGSGLSGGNTASEENAFVGAGAGNIASGPNSAIPGGLQNTASATCTHASGQLATAAHGNSFVWADNNATTTTATNQFVVSAVGAGALATIFYTNAAQTTGVTLSSGASAWAAVSDRRVKENLEDLSPADILSRVGQLPVYSYNYIGNPAGQRCWGPMADDWHRLFPSTKDPTRIESMDLSGVSLAAIKGAALLITELQEKVASLESRLAGLQSI